MSIADKITRAKNDYDEVYEAGKQAEYDNFWNGFQDNGNRTSYYAAFYSAYWTNENFKPKYDFKVGLGSKMFRFCGIEGDFAALLTSLGVSLTLTASTELINEMFADCALITRLPEIKAERRQNIDSIFANCRKLHTIDKLNISAATTYNRVFNQCYALQNLTIDGILPVVVGTSRTLDLSYSSALTVESAKSVINALQNAYGQSYEFMGTLTLHTDVWARLNTDSAPPTGATWQEYVSTLGWLTA